jgi:hypothetical protein
VIVRDEAETRRLLHRRTRRRRTAWIAIAAVGAVVLVLIGTGILPLFPPTAAWEGIPYSRAYTLANDSVPAGLGIHGKVLIATAIDARNATTLSPSALVANATANCTVTNLSGLPPSGQLYVPPFAGSFSAGIAPWWIFVFEAGANGPFAIVAVVNTTAFALAELSGPKCTTSSAGLDPLPSGVVDSPTAALAAWNGTGAGYVGAHPNATTLTMTAFGGITVIVPVYPASWLFVYGSCSPLAGGSVSSTARVATVGLTSGSFVSGAPYSIHCPA